MATKQLALLGDTNVVIGADTNATGNTVALRDSSGNLAAAQMSASELKSTAQLTLATPVTKTTTFTASTDTDHYLVDGTSAIFTATLPAAAAVTGRVYVFTKIDAAHNVTIAGNGAELINGGNTVVMSVQWGILRIRSNGTSWFSC